jgi:hypothetical protein
MSAVLSGHAAWAAVPRFWEAKGVLADAAVRLTVKPSVDASASVSQQFFWRREDVGLSQSSLSGSKTATCSALPPDHEQLG